MKVIKLISIVWMILFMLIGVGLLISTPNQITKDRKFIISHIRPAVEYVQQYFELNNSLPSDSLLMQWNRKNDNTAQIITSPSSLPDDLKIFKNNMPKNGWILSVWRGEWNEYFISWQGRYITNSYSWKDGIESLLFSIFVGILPLLIVLTIITFTRKPTKK